MQSSPGLGVFVARLLMFILVALAGCTTAIPRNEQDLPVVRSLALYKELIGRDPSKRLVDLRDTIPGIVIDIRYATEDNFMQQPVYDVARPLLRAPAAKALQAVQRELATQGLGIKIWNAYRPYRVTQKMWALIRNPDFVADPSRGSRHNRGAAVDLTLVDRATGRELEMPHAMMNFHPARTTISQSLGSRRCGIERCCGRLWSATALSASRQNGGTTTFADGNDLN